MLNYQTKKYNYYTWLSIKINCNLFLLSPSKGHFDLRYYPTVSDFPNNSAVPNRFKSRHYHHLSSLFSFFFSSVSNRFKWIKNALCTVIILIFCLQFQIVLNSVRMHPLEILFLKFPLKLQIVPNSISNSVRMYHFTVQKLFSNLSVVADPLPHAPLPPLVPQNPRSAPELRCF